jgi:hypothetical protein
MSWVWTSKNIAVIKRLIESHTHSFVIIYWLVGQGNLNTRKNSSTFDIITSNWNTLNCAKLKFKKPK